MKNNLFQSVVVKMMLVLVLIFSVLPMQTVADVDSQTDITTLETEGESTESTSEQVETDEESEAAQDVHSDDVGDDLDLTVTPSERDEAEEQFESVKGKTEAIFTSETDESDGEVEEDTEVTDGLHVTIMHMNDTHAHLDPMPQMVSAIKDVRSKHDHTLLLHAGDVFSGTLYFNKYKGQADLALMNMMGFDAMVYGNHEFDLGSGEGGHESLANFVAGANFPLLGTNIDFSADPYMKGLVHPNKLVENPAGGKSYHSIVKNINGEKVGIFGLTTEDTVAISSPVSVKFLNYYTTAVEAVHAFEAAGINKIIAVTHLGYDSNPAVGNDLTLAKIDGIDVIVGGHTHTKLSTPTVVTKDVNGNEKDPTVIVQAHQYAGVLGQLDVEFDENGVLTKHDGQLIDISSYAADPDASAKLTEYRDEIENLKNEPSGAVALKDLLNPRLTDGNNDSVRANETELGNLITDAMLAKAKEKFPETVIAVQNGGGIRAPIAKGPITVGEIIEVLPFGNDPVVVTLSGAELKEIFEHSVRLAPDESGGFLHVSGMRLIYDSDQEVGKRVAKIELKQDGKYIEILEDGEYMITTNQFTAMGGDGFETFAKAYAEGRVKNIGELDWEQLRSYMVEDLGGEVDPVREGRIIDVARDEVPVDDPVDPTDPTDPTDPIDPTDPTDPGKPGGPSKGDPTKPVEDPQADEDLNKGNGKQVIIKDGEDKEKSGKKLPKTATTIYTTLLIGGLILLAGIAIFVYRKLKVN